jgi:hypothetical protein
MGACGCGGDSKDSEIDMYMDKHHRAHIVTSKDNYEVSKLTLSKTAVVAQKAQKELLIDDEK